MRRLGNVSQKKILITGIGAQLGVYFQKTAPRDNLRIHGLTHAQLDIADYDDLKNIVEEIKPDILINCASYNLIDLAESEPQQAVRINAQAVERMADLCRDKGIFLVHYSSAHVFDGQQTKPYGEEDAAHPVNVYGQSKLQGELAVRSVMKDYLVFRLSWVFGTGKNCFLTKVSQWAKTNPALKISSDEVSIPAYSQDVVDMTILSLQKGLSGLYHLTSNGSCSRLEYVRYFCGKMGIRNPLIPVEAASFNLPAKRPLYSCMSNQRLSYDLNVGLPAWQDGLDRFTQRLKNNEF